MLKQRKQIRLKNYDYSRSGYYYITMCTENRSCIFGNIFNGKMILNEFVIMPNHIHGIVIIVGAGLSRPILGQIIGYFKYQSTKHINNLLGSENPTPTIEIKKIFQRNYYERIIRNENQLFKIRQYIKYNPIFWQNDINYV